jgi:hypothetical protein
MFKSISKIFRANTNELKRKRCRTFLDRICHFPLYVGEIDFNRNLIKPFLKDWMQIRTKEKTDIGVPGVFLTWLAIVLNLQNFISLGI